MLNKILWLTGPSGSGKTTLAKEIQKQWPCLILDGNEMRDSISCEYGFSREHRAAHNLRVARLAEVISRQTNVVVSVIAPIEKIRAAIDGICLPVWVYIKRTLPEREGHFYEEPDDYFTVNSDVCSPRENAFKVLKYIGVLPKKKYSMFVGRYSPPHQGHKALFDKVYNEGKEVLVAIRDTNISETDPYTAYERKQMLQELVPYAKIIIIDDIEEQCYGRKVGWGIREIRLDEKTEAISATEIRNKK